VLTVLKKVNAMPLGRHMTATRFNEVRVNGESSRLTRLACLLAAVNGAKKVTAMHHISVIACLVGSGKKK
jgi:hypothetical protein